VPNILHDDFSHIMPRATRKEMSDQLVLNCQPSFQNLLFLAQNLLRNC